MLDRLCHLWINRSGKDRAKKVAAALRHSPAFAARIEASRQTEVSSRQIWKPECNRIQNVVLKLVRGHVAHQYSEPQLDDPTRITIAPFELMSEEQRDDFENVPESSLWPEIGSRAFVNLLESGGSIYEPESGWSILQDGRCNFKTYALGDE